ncbi:MAG: carboxypeptidase-like regulatory domain-containing protein [Cyclobacteriaceae bacterium]|nr:carboxypeptidase-like regulatory domain-containing protein [Cyclobacteriaceae bacterium]
MEVYNQQFVQEKSKFVFVVSFLLIVFMTISAGETFAQKQKVLQLSGIILGEDSISGLPGVHIYVPKRQDGTTSNYLGFFSLPVIVGDSLVFSAVGYQHQSYVVPDFEGKQVTLIVEMMTDTTYLENVTIMPFPTEELFKEAILALRLPEEENVSQDHLNDQILALMMRSMPMDANANYRYYMDQVVYNQTYRYGIRPNPFLNPFNWAKFIKSLKNR